MSRLLAPNRPDWRWARVAELTEYIDAQALARLRKDDEPTRRAFRFKRALDRGFGADEYPEIEAAYAIYLDEPHSRMCLEALLLAGAHDDQIQEHMWIDGSVIEAYHDIFFCVRPGLNKVAWVCSAVFGGFPHQGAHRSDRHGIALRLAWLGGYDVVETLMKDGFAPDRARVAMLTVMKDTMIKHAMETSLTLGNSYEVPEWLRIVVESGKDEKVAAADEDLLSAVDTFLDGYALSVADPTEERNLNLPKREARVADYEVIEDAG